MRVPPPVAEKVKQVLCRMEKMGFIRHIKEPIACCAGVIVVSKFSDSSRICVNLTKLNKSVCRERHILLTVDDTLAVQLFKKN